MKYSDPDPSVWAARIRNYLYGAGFFHQQGEQTIRNEEKLDFYCFVTINDLLSLKFDVNVVAESTVLASRKQRRKRAGSGSGTDPDPSPDP